MPEARVGSLCFGLRLGAWRQVEAQQILQIHENIVRRGLSDARHVCFQTMHTYSLLVQLFAYFLVYLQDPRFASPAVCASIVSGCLPGCIPVCSDPSFHIAAKYLFVSSRGEPLRDQGQAKTRIQSEQTSCGTTSCRQNRSGD